MDTRADVVVVGAGGSGLAAAIEARRAGATVALLEKNAAPGGSTAWSVGSVTATGTPHQQRRGIADDAASHAADMALFNGALEARDNTALRDILCMEIPATFRWLESLGVRFHGPMPEPPHRLPRMHNVLPNSRAFVHHLAAAARRAGVALHAGCRAVTLLQDAGRVSGVACAGGRRFLAARAVVLAGGDFTSDPELKARHLGEAAARVEGVNPTATGDAQKLALALGAHILNGDLALGPELRFIAPHHPPLVGRLPPWPALAQLLDWSLGHLPPALLRPFVMAFLTTALAPSRALFEQGAVLVDGGGARFCDELAEPALALAARPGKRGYILLDGALASRFSAWPYFVSTAPGVAYAYVPDYRRSRRDVYAEAPSLAALARRLGFPPGALEGAVAGRGGYTCGPFVALGPVRPVFVHNEGGLAVDTQHRVLGAGMQPIPGLYAAGATGQGGLLLRGHGHHLAWAFVSGRRAGRLAAGDAPAAAA